MPPSVPASARHALFALLVQMTGVGAGYLLHVALARWMGAASYGSYSYGMAWIGLLSMAAALGLPVCSVRFLSQYHATAQPALLRGTIRRFRQLVLVAGTAMAVLGTATVVIFPGVPRWVAVAAWLVPLSSFVNLNTEMARGLGRPTLSQVPDKVFRPLATLVGAALFYRAVGAISIGQVMFAALCAAGVVALFQVTALAGVITSVATRGAAEYRTREWVRVSVSLLAVSVLVLLLGQIDLLIAGTMLDPAQIGVYSAAIRVASLIGFIPLSVTIVNSPQIAALYAKNDRPRLQQLASHIAHLSFWPSLVLAAGVMLLARPILRLFGPEFVEARWALWILAACQLFKSAMGAVGYFLDMTGHQLYNARAFAVATVIGAVLNLIAIPRFGISGAAVANLVSWVVVMLLLHREVALRVGVRASVVSALRLQPGRSRPALT